jgi:hypothetical protein
MYAHQPSRGLDLLIEEPEDYPLLAVLAPFYTASASAK